jgi:glycosyltransferase involved in cell wall biosynthesis
VRGKILEAMAAGIPVVSTTLGAEGLPVRDGHDILLADTADDFAAALDTLINNPDLQTKIVDNAYSLSKQFDYARVTEKMRQDLKKFLV